MDTTENKTLNIHHEIECDQPFNLDIELLAERIKGLNPSTYIDYHARTAAKDAAQRWAFLHTFSTDLTKKHLTNE